MDLMLLRLFQQQVRFQCEAVLFAAVGVNEALRAVNAAPNYEANRVAFARLFYEVQNLLNAAANISKACWGAGGKLATQRQPLRDSIGVTDASPLCDMSMRNNYEHFDERLDRWWRESANHNSMDFSIGGPRVIGLDPIEMFRHFDPVTTELGFWGETFNVQALVNEVQRILPTVTLEASKPHWERPTDEQRR